MTEQNLIVHFLSEIKQEKFHPKKLIFGEWCNQQKSEGLLLRCYQDKNRLWCRSGLCL